MSKFDEYPIRPVVANRGEGKKYCRWCFFPYAVLENGRCERCGRLESEEFAEQEPNPRGECESCGANIRYYDRFCSQCGARNNSWMGWRPETCGHCHASLDPDDRYCRICGTKVGEGSFTPYQNLMQCIYGPMPVERKHTCKKCGFEWTNEVMIDNDRYCPQCGGSKISVTGKDVFRWNMDEESTDIGVMAGSDWDSFQ